MLPLSVVTNRLIWIDYSCLIKNRKVNRKDNEGPKLSKNEVKSEYDFNISQANVKKFRNFRNGHEIFSNIYFC